MRRVYFLHEKGFFFRKFSVTAIATAMSFFAFAQQGVINFGNMHLFDGALMNTPLTFSNNASGGTDYRNDGYFSLQGNFINNKANMPAGTGTTEFNSTALQNIGGTNLPQFNHLLITNAAVPGVQPLVDFNVAGNWTNNGNFFHNDLAVNFNGTGLQTATGSVKTVFYKLSLSNTTAPVSMQLSQTTELLKEFSFVGPGGSLLASNGFLHVKSSDTLTGRLADMTINNTVSGNSITGNVTVERYIQSGRKWRYLSVPTNSVQTVRESWMEGAANISQNPKPGFGTIVTDNAGGAVAAGFDAQSVSGPSVKYYNAATSSYTGITSPSVLINGQKSYMNFVRGDRTALPSNGILTPTILRTTGPAKQGVISGYSLGSGLIDGVGNPYASRIDLRIVTKTNLTDYVYLWDPLLTGGYGVGAFQSLQYDGADYRIMPGGGSYGAAGSIQNIIESGQGFFMQGNTGGGSVQFTEPAKVSGSSVVNFADPNGQWLRAMLSIVNDTVHTLVDGAQADFGSGFTNVFSLEDGLKMVNTSENVAIKTGNKLLVYERHAPIVNDDTIHLNLTGLRYGNYRWDFVTQNLGAPGRQGFIADRSDNSLTPMALNDHNLFSFTVSTTPASYSADRFYIIFKTLAVVPVKFTYLTARRVAESTINVSWKTENEISIARYEVERSADGVSFSTLENNIPTTNNNGGQAEYAINDNHPLRGNNFYRIRAHETSGTFYYSNVAKVSPAGSGDIAVYPNPVAENNIHIYFDAQPAGIYSLQLINSAGQLMANKTAKINNGYDVVKLDAGSTTAAGVYQLVVTNAAGKKKIIQVILK